MEGEASISQAQSLKYEIEVPPHSGISQRNPIVTNFILKKGTFEPLGVSSRRLEMAETGHSGEPVILGTVINLTSLAYCRVFDHLTKTTIFPGLNIMSP